jgi:hypothetical protein
MKDIVPELQKSILADFQSQVEEDYKIQRILSGEDEKATFADVSKLSARLGEYAADSLKRNLTDETLPDGVLYWNIAKRTIVPLMQEVQKIALDMAEAVQTREDKKAGIGIKPIRPEFNEERIEAVINRVIFMSQMEVPEVGQ